MDVNILDGHVCCCGIEDKMWTRDAFGGSLTGLRGRVPGHVDKYWRVAELAGDVLGEEIDDKGGTST